MAKSKRARKPRMPKVPPLALACEHLYGYAVCKHCVPDVIVRAKLNERLALARAVPLPPDGPAGIEREDGYMPGRCVSQAAFVVETVAHLQGQERELLPIADALRKLAPTPRAVGVGAYYCERLGDFPWRAVIRETDLNECLIETVCGLDCKAAIDCAAALIAHIKAAYGSDPPAEHQIKLATLHVIQTYCFG